MSDTVWQAATSTRRQAATISNLARPTIEEEGDGCEK